MSTIIKRIISTAKAPRPAAPYNQAIVVDRTVYLSGVLGIDKDSGKLVSGGAASEATKALENMGNILEAAGSKFENVIKCTVLLNDIADFAAVNQEYTKVFTSNFPARTCFQVGKLPLGASVEIEVIAITGDVKTEIVSVSKIKNLAVHIMTSTIVKKIISTSQCPRPVATYNQAIVTDRIAYLSGVVGIDKDTNKLVPGGIVPETIKALDNILKLLNAVGSNVDNVIKCTLLLNNINDFSVVNEEYAKVFSSNYPARTCYQAGNLPIGAAIEIEVIAVVGNVKVEVENSTHKL
ncbi:CLUMA_CG009123, isoform A [Clunio marinus]|uniref:CLUMA_CG009123, isoform A n=1 Tax=Clunio marinus TaxID=568069 RepID=A0A1J1IB47_9DIPT|nr:CLUMA_CG009123, isoform A [Clunio marinus]